jgi:hypothetical protein
VERNRIHIVLRRQGRGRGGAYHGLLVHDTGAGAHLSPRDASQSELGGGGDLPSRAGLRQLLDGGGDLPAPAGLRHHLDAGSPGELTGCVPLFSRCTC